MCVSNAPKCRYMATFSSTYHLSARGQLTSPRNESQEKQAERLLHHCMHELLVN